MGRYWTRFAGKIADRARETVTILADPRAEPVIRRAQPAAA